MAVSSMFSICRRSWYGPEWFRVAARMKKTVSVSELRMWMSSPSGWPSFVHITCGRGFPYGEVSGGAHQWRCGAAL